MQFSCPQCATKYAVPDDKVRGKRIRTKCRKCGAEIVVDGPGAGSIPPGSRQPASAQPAPDSREARPPESREEEKWTVAVDRSTQRKMTTAELTDAYARKEIDDRTLVWKQGMPSWQPPFEIPAIALALRSRGLEKGSPAGKAPPAAPAAAPAGASKGAAGAGAAWDDENEATRVVDGALAFPGRPVIAARPAPATAAAPAPPPASSGFEEDEATRVVAPTEARNLLAPIARAREPAPPQPAKLPPAPKPVFKTQLGLAAPPVPMKVPAPVPPPPPVPVPRTLPVQETPPAPPSPVSAAPATPRSPASARGPSSMDFDDEATAVIAPDRARALLEEEAAKSGKGQTETPLSFGFDDEATLVVAPETAGELLSGAKSQATIKAESGKAPAAAVAAPARPAEPPPPSSAPQTEPSPGDREAQRGKPAPVESGPSVVFTAPKPAQKPLPDQAVPPSRDMSSLSHEKTRVVRVKKKSSGTLFWVTLTIALLAAAIGGFVASRLFDGQKLPSWMHIG